MNVAIYTRRKAERDQILDELHRHVDISPTNNAFFYFSEDSNSIDFPYSQQDIGSVLRPNLQNQFHTLIVSPAIRLYNNTWSQVFLQQLYATLKVKGTLYISARSITFSGRNARLLRRLSARGIFRLWVRQAVGHWGTAVKGTDYIAVTRTPFVPQHRESILAWYFDQYAHLALDVLHLSKGIPSVEQFKQTLPDGMVEAPSQWRTVSKGAWVEHHQTETELEAVHHFQKYAVYGANGKSQALHHILRDFFGGRAIRYLDHGSGMGLVPAELVLSRKTRIKQAVATDVMPRNILMASRLHNYYTQHLDGILKYALVTMADYQYTQNWDVISFIGSLLYAGDFATRKDCLQMAWENLAPKGLLILHENVKTDRWQDNVDYNVMFTLNELKDILEPFGPVYHYSSWLGHRITEEDAAERTVFRIVQKK